MDNLFPRLTFINGKEKPYTFVEYPKWVTLADGSKLIVENEEEERAATGTESFVYDGNDETVVVLADSECVERDDVDIDSLREKALSMGLKPHPRCGIEKLKKMIAEA